MPVHVSNASVRAHVYTHVHATCLVRRFVSDRGEFDEPGYTAMHLHYTYPHLHRHVCTSTCMYMYMDPCIDGLYTPCV